MSSYLNYVNGRIGELNEVALESKHIKFMRWAKRQLEEIEDADDDYDFERVASLEHDFYRSALEVAADYNPLLKEFTDSVLAANDLITKRY